MIQSIGTHFCFLHFLLSGQVPVILVRWQYHRVFCSKSEIKSKKENTLDLKMFCPFSHSSKMQSVASSSDRVFPFDRKSLMNIRVRTPKDLCLLVLIEIKFSPLISSSSDICSFFDLFFNPTYFNSVSKAWD